MALMTVMPFYGCKLGPALQMLAQRERIVLTTDNVGFDGAVYTTAEAIQRVRFCRGEVAIPRRLRALCNLPVDADPVRDDLSRFAQADMALMEPYTVADFCLGPYTFHRGAVNNLLDEIAAGNPELTAAATAWFHQGILAHDRDTRRRCAEILIPALKGREDEATAAEMLSEARGETQDFDAYLAGLATLRDLIAMPLGIATYAYQHLPDGRPISWPADFLDNTIEAARRLNLPVFDSVAIVRKHGVAKSLDATRQFYREEFYPVVGDAIMEFFQSVIEGRGAAPAESGTPPIVVRGANLFGDRRSFSAGRWEAFRAALVRTDPPDAAPAGLVAVKLIEEATSADAIRGDTHDVRRSWPCREGGGYAMSFFAHAAERTALRLMLGEQAFERRAEAVFDLLRGTANIVAEANSGVSSVAAGMIPMADGWWWCWLSGRFKPAEKMTASLGLRDADASEYRGDGCSGAWIAGPRLEAGLQPVLDLNERGGMFRRLRQ